MFSIIIIIKVRLIYRWSDFYVSQLNFKGEKFMLKYELDLKTLRIETLEVLAKESDKELLIILAKNFSSCGEIGSNLLKNPQIPTEAIDELIFSGITYMRIQTLATKKASKKALEKRFEKLKKEQGEYSSVELMAIVRHPQISTEFLEEHLYDKDIDESVANVILEELRKKISE